MFFIDSIFAYKYRAFEIYFCFMYYSIFRSCEIYGGIMAELYIFRNDN